MAEYSFNDYLSAFGKAIGQSGTPRTPSAGQSGRQRSAPIAGPGFNQPKPKQETEQKRNLLQKAFDTVSARAAQQEQQKLKAPAVQDDSAYAKGVDFYKNSPMANAPNKQNGTGNLTMDSKIVAAEPYVLAQQGEKVASAARERDDALKRAELADRRAGDIMSYYGGKRDENGTVVFSKDGGAEKYSELQLQAQGHLDAALGAEKNMTKAVEAYAAAADVAAQAKTDADAAFDKLPEAAVSVLAKHGNAAAAQNLLDRQEKQDSAVKKYYENGGTFGTAMDGYSQSEKDYTAAYQRYVTAASSMNGFVDRFIANVQDESWKNALTEARDKDIAEGKEIGDGLVATAYGNFFAAANALGLKADVFAEDSIAELADAEKEYLVAEPAYQEAAYLKNGALRVAMDEAAQDARWDELSKPVSGEPKVSGALADAYKYSRWKITQTAPSYFEDPAFSQQWSEKAGNDIDFGDFTLTPQDVFQLTDGERALFFYFCNKGDSESATQFLRSMKTGLRYRSGEALADVVDVPVIRQMYAFGEGVISGVENVGRGIVSMLPGDGLDPKELSAGELAVGELINRNDGVAGWTISAAQNVGNQIPSIAMQAINPWAGTATIFFNARGSAYDEARRSGASHGQAWVYGNLVGASEAGLERVLGAMGGTASGMLPKKLIQMFSKEGASAARTVLTKFGSDLAGEIVEENLQNYLEPAFAMLVGMADDYEAPGFKEFLDTTIVTAMSTVLMSAPGMRTEYNAAKYDNLVRDYAKQLTERGEGTPEYEAGMKLSDAMKDLKRGEHINPDFLHGVMLECSAKTGVAWDESQMTQAQVQAQETQERAAQVQEQNPEATVVRSAGAQAYLDSGKATLAVAQKAGDVLDKIVSGEITSGTVTSSQIDALLTKHEYGRNVVSKVLGVEVRRAANASQQRQAVRDAIRSYEAQREAMMQRGTADTSEQNIVATGENAPTVNEQDNAVQFDGQQEASAEARTGAQTQAVSEAAPVPSQETMQAVQTERQAGVMKYGSFKYRFQNDKVFRSRYAQGKSASGDASRTLAAYENYRRMIRDALDTGETLTRDAFGRIYSEMNDTKKIKSSDAEIDLAYQEYLNERGDAKPEVAETQPKQTDQTEQTGQTAQTVGLFENEFSASVPQEVRMAVDALARELGLRVRYADLGNDNGYYNTKTGEVVLDVNPARRSVDEAGRSAYLFTVAHEIGHYAKQHMSKTSWAAFERHAISALGGDAALEAKRGEVDESGERVYKTEDDVREDVACDFIGQVMSSGKALGEFVTAIRENKVSTASANGILRAIKRALGKLTGKNKGISEGLKLFSEDIAAGRIAVDEITKALAGVAKQTRGVPTTEQTEANQSGAKENAAETGDVKSSKKNNTKRSATSPLSGSPATQGSVGVASKPVTAAAEHLGIKINVSQLSNSVKRAISAFSEIVDAIENRTPVFGGKKIISAWNIEGALIKVGVLQRGATESAYLEDGDHTLRVSSHSARADNFTTNGENLSVVLLTTNKTNDFVESDNHNVIEVQFKKDYLDRNPEAFKNLVKDMAKFVATGEYHDTAGAKNYNISGTEQFRTEMAQRLAEDERARSAAAKDTVKRSRKDAPATNMDSNGKRLSEGQRAYFQNSVVRDDAGNLLVVYHGTDAEFTVFDILKAGKNGRAEGYGFYFSDDQEITRKYGDRQMGVYLNITKPLYSDRRTLTKAELRRFTDAVVSKEMQEYETDWRDSFISNYVDTYTGRMSRQTAVQSFVNQIWEMNETDQDLIYEIANGSGQNYNAETMKGFYETLRDSIGVDGNISTWRHADGESNVYVAFFPEQAKNVDNVNPTKDTDIRRSRKDTHRRVIPTPEQAQALEEKRKARESEKEAERIRQRDEFMRNFVRSAPGVAPHLQRSAMDTDIRRSRKEQRIEDLVEKHGAIPTGENPVRDVSVPNRTTEDTRVRRTVRTAMEAGVTPEALIPKIEESIVEGNFNYNPKKNAETMEAAHEWVERRKTVDDAYKDWLSAKKNHINADMIARGFIIYNNYANAAETVKSEAERVKLQQNAVSILQDISVMGTVAGQTAQAMRLLKKQTPESQYYALERAVQKLQDGINDRYGGKKADAPKIEIDKKLAGKWLQALREGDMELAYDLEAVLFQNIASQIPKTLGDRMNAWRYLSMLGNPKTLIRNAVGNAAFTPVVMAKDKIGAAMELFLEKDKRTKYLGLLHASEEGRALLKFASEDGQRADVLQLMERNKYDDTSLNDRLARYVQEKKRTFTAPVLKQWQAATRYMMEKAPFMGDEFYKSVHYRRAFAGAAMARGYTVSDLTSGKVSEMKLMELRVYAANQAMKATFNDANKVSDLVSRARFKNNVANTALEGTLPFKRTPANVAVRSFEYSPAGLLKALSTDIYALKTGKITWQEYIERLSQGVTGSVMFGLGWLAAALGIVRVNVDDDDEREGRQSYSIEVFGKSVTLDWLAPTSVAFFMGSETQELLSGWGEDQSFLDAMLDSASNLFAPVLEMTALSGAKDLLDTFVYSYKKDGADVGQITMALFVQPFLSYLGQYAPTIFGQGENLFEPYRTTTYVGDINGKVERVFVRNFAKILEKVPFVDLRQIEYVDEWGRKDYNGDIPLRFFNSFINPAYVNDIVPTEVDAEVRRIKETTGKNVSPTKRGYKITVSEYDEDGDKLDSREVVLSAEQYRDYQMEYGTQYALMASALMASEYYDTLSDSEKAKAFKEIESLADEYGKLAANVGYMIDPGSTDNKLYSLVQMGMPAAEAYSARLMYTQINNDDEMKPVERYEQFRVWVYGNDAWTEEEKQAVIDRFGKFSSGFVAESENFDEMLRLGVDADKAMSINDGIRNLKPEDGLMNVSLSQKYGHILSRSDLSIAEKNAAIKSYMSSNETDAFAPCEAAGITATEYAEVVLKIGDLEPIGENKGVTAAQKYEVCVKSFSSEAKQDAMLRRYMSAETEAKYDTLRDSGVSPATYVAWYSAKYTYGDGNGSWKQDELEKWLRENVSSRSQRAALWEATNAGWKNNPFK